jgi:glyoxylase-like metal-dependent hydrolase (beta-lactamase superfamily II)
MTSSGWATHSVFRTSNPDLWSAVPITRATRCRLSQFREVYAGVYALALPLPFELKSVNVYLVKLDDGYLLIDCGMETDPAFKTLRDAMADLAIGWRQIRQILLTHMHPDHMGMAAHLLELSGAQLAMHHAEARQLQLVTGGGRRIPWLDEAYRQAGVPKPMESKMEAHFLAIRGNFHHLAPDRLLDGGEEIPTGIGPLQVLWTSGHSPGHVCLYSAQRKLLFSGDQILENITPNISWHPGRDMLAEFLESLDRMTSLDVDLILPGHGAPFSGHRTWIAQTIVHHRQRCDAISALLERSPRTAHQMVPDLWPKALSPINHHFAIFEVLAHLEHMQRQGRIGHRQKNGALEWHA